MNVQPSTSSEEKTSQPDQETQVRETPTAISQKPESNDFEKQTEADIYGNSPKPDEDRAGSPQEVEQLAISDDDDF